MPDLNNPNPTDTPQGSVVPSPPPPTGGSASVDVRTQASDIQSIKQSGGGSPTPKQFNLGEIGNGTPTPSTPTGLPSTPPASPTPPPVTPTPPMSGETPPPPPTGGPSGLPNPASKEEPVFDPSQGTPASGSKLSLKRIGLITGVIVSLAVLGWVGYQYVYPIFFNDVSNLIPTPPPSSSVIEENEVVQPETPTVITHNAYANFTLSNSAIGPIYLATTFSLDLTNTIRSQELDAESVTETLVADINGNQESFSNLLGILIPEVSQEELVNLFEPDFTAFIYTDVDSNKWPGYIAKLKPGASLLDAQNALAVLESSNSLSNLFIEDPGTATPESFKDGQINSLPSRYLTYDGESGGAINYFWSGDKFILVTSYKSAQVIEPLIK